MFIEISEKISTSIEPIFLWAELLYSSHEPAMISRPAIVPHICIMVASAGSDRSESGDEVSRNAPSMVTRPASTESAKAAVGFGSVFVAKAHRNNHLSLSNLSTSCNLLIHANE